MSMRSPRSSCTTACTRLPFMPTQAPTGIDVGVARGDGDLGARARLAGGRDDRHDALVDLGHLLLEQLGQHLHRGAREHDLRPLADAVDVLHVGADAVARAVGLARRLLLRREHGLGAAEVDDDRALLEAPHDAVHDLALAVLVLLVDDVALGVADALDDHLLRRLGEDAPEAARVELDADLVADLGLGVVLVRLAQVDLRGRIEDALDDLAELEQLDLADLLVEAGLDLALLAELLLGGLAHRLFEGLDDHLLVDALVLGDLIDLALERCQIHRAYL